jgi:hypothetical protein
VSCFPDFERNLSFAADGIEIGAGVAMTCSMPARFVSILALPLFLLALATPAWSQERSGFAKEGGFVGVSGVLDFTLDGDTFDGQSIYKRVNGEEFLILPLLEGQNMFRGILGVRGPKAAFELSYDRAQHHGTFVGETTEATFQAVNADARLFFLTSGRVQPHVLVGAALPWLTIKDGSFLDPDVGNARYRGFGVNTEAGVTVYPHPRFGISAGYRYRVIWFDRATGVSDTFYELRPRFRTTNGSVVMTGLFSF